MDNRAYRIGGIMVNPADMKYEGDDPCKAGHKFLVVAEDDDISVYVAPRKSSFDIAAEFGLLGSNRAAAGTVYLNTDDELILYSSPDYCCSMPGEVAEKIAWKLFDRLVHDHMILPSDARAIFRKDRVNPYWIG